MMALRADVDFIAASANTEKKQVVLDASEPEERCFGANAVWLNAVWKKSCSTVGNAKSFHAISCKSFLMTKNKVTMAKGLEILSSGASKPRSSESATSTGWQEMAVAGAF